MTPQVDETHENPRYLLRAYESTDCVRIAQLVGADERVSRAELRRRLLERFPEHAERTGRRHIGNRLAMALSVMAAAGLIERVEGEVVVLDRAGLNMAVRNAAIVLDGDGRSVRPGLWERVPEVPERLKQAQQRKGDGAESA